MARRTAKAEARHYEQAIDQVESFYPQDIFGKGDAPLKNDTPESVVRLVEAKAARMARLTCAHIRRFAQELAENENP